MKEYELHEQSVFKSEKSLVPPPIGQTFARCKHTQASALSFEGVLLAHMQ